MIRASKAAITDLASERLGACVLAYVPGQLVRAGESPAAGLEMALVGLLPGVDTLVGFEVGTFGVSFAATCRSKRKQISLIICRSLRRLIKGKHLSE